MGFSLMGFGAGLAESAIERIEEERKFSNLALQGRIERASVLKMQREKEAEAIRQELTAQRASLEQFGITDPELQKAYLSAPTAAEALKKTLETGNVGKDAVNQYAREFITINQSRLFQGTPDDMIKAAAAARAGTTVEPARVMPTEGGSIFAPSVSGQQRRLQQLASARGMTLEEVARAESPMAPARPEVAASINLEKLKKPEKEDADDKSKRLLKRAADAALEFGNDDPRTIRARADYNAWTAEVRRNRPLTHEQRLSEARTILYDPESTATPEEKARAKQYIESSVQERRRETGEGADKRTEATALTGFRERGANAVLLKYGGRKGFTQREIDLGEGQGKLFDLQYTDDNPELRKEVMAYRQLAMLTHPSVIEEMQKNNGEVLNKKLRNSLGSFGINFNSKNEPVLVNGKTLSQALEDERAGTGSAASTGTSTVQSTPNRAPAMVPTAPGVRKGRTVAPAPAGIASPTTEEEVKALKPGTLFINPSDGKTYTKN
jgi:hypothetical protein